MAQQATAKTELFAQWQQGNLVVADQGLSTGSRWWVDDSGTDAAGYGRSPSAPFATLAYAFSSDSVSAGDVVYVMEGHAESVIAAGTITQDIAGVKVIGLGAGANRPVFTFTTDTAATWVVSGASSWIENVVLYAALDNVVNNLVISAADCVIKDVTIRDTSSAVEFVGSILTTAAADRLVIDGLEYQGFIAGSACTRVIQLVGINDCKILNCSFYGEIGTAIVDITTASHNVAVDNCYFYNDNIALSKNVVDTVGGSTWAVSNCYDGKGGYSFSGGSAAALAADDVGSVATAVGVVSTAVSGLTSYAAVGATSAAVSTLASYAAVGATSVAVSVVTSYAATSSAAVSGLTSRATVGATSAAVSTLASYAAVGATSTAVSTLASYAAVGATSVAVSAVTSYVVTSSAAVSGLTSYAAVGATSAAVSALASYAAVGATSVAVSTLASYAAVGATSAAVSVATSYAVTSSTAVSGLTSSLAVVSTSLSTILSYVVSGW